MARYLVGQKRVVRRHWEIQSCKVVLVYTDATWACDRRTRGSTSDGRIMMGAHWAKAWSKTQRLIALSTVESELYAAVGASVEGLGVQSVA